MRRNPLLLLFLALFLLVQGATRLPAQGTNDAPTTKSSATATPGGTADKMETGKTTADTGTSADSTSGTTQPKPRRIRKLYIVIAVAVLGIIGFFIMQATKKKSN